MAIQLEVTVSSVNGITNEPFPLSLPINSIFIQSRSSGCQIEYFSSNGSPDIYLVNESFSDLETTIGDSMVAATVYRVGNFTQSSPVSMLFPSNSITIRVASGNDINSSILFNGINYFASETQSELIQSANSGGGGGNTIYTGDGELSGNRVVDANSHDLSFINGGTFTYTADTHTFNGDTILADLAGGGTTGLSIDNDGKIIRTP